MIRIVSLGVVVLRLVVVVGCPPARGRSAFGTLDMMVVFVVRVVALLVVGVDVVMLWVLGTPSVRMGVVVVVGCDPGNKPTTSAWALKLRSKALPLNGSACCCGSVGVASVEVDAACVVVRVVVPVVGVHAASVMVDV
jgi:hypothetical protein